MKFSYKLISFSLSIVILLSIIFSPISAYAYESYDILGMLIDSGKLGVDFLDDVIKYIGSQSGCLIAGDLDSFDANNTELKNKHEELKKKLRALPVKKGGGLDIPTDVTNEVKDYLDTYIEDMGDYYLSRTFSYKEFLDFIESKRGTGDSSGWKYKWYQESLIADFYDRLYSSNECYVRYMKAPVSLPDGGKITNDTLFVYDIDLDDCYYVLSTATSTGVRYANILNAKDFGFSYNVSSTAFVYGYTLITNGVSVPPLNINADFFLRDTYAKGVMCDWVHNGRNLLTVDGHSVKVWKNVTKLKDYLRGAPSQKNIYTTKKYQTYNVNNDNSINITQNTFNNIVNNNISTEINNVYNNITNTINNYYTENNTYMTEQNIQNIVNEQITSIINNYNKPDETIDPTEPVDPDNPDNPGKPGGDISGNNPGGTVSGNGTDGPQTIGLLQQILDFLKQGFENILDSLKSIKKAITGNTIVEGIGSIADIGGFLSDLVSGGIEKADDILGSIGSSLAPVAEMLPEKFPTCIPWDLIAIFTVMVAEPEPPVYELPFNVSILNFNENITVDLSPFEPLAKISRTVLTLLFVLLLIHVTIKLTSGKEVE